MPRYSVFLGFELETETAEAARDAAREMIERRVEFPEVVSCVGVETPPCRLPTIEYMVALVHAMHDEAIRHAAKSN